MAKRNNNSGNNGNRNGGNNGSNNNGGDGGDDDGGDDDELTDGQINRITNIVNAAVSGQLSRKLPNAITSALETGLAPLREQMEQLAGGGRRRADNDDEGDDDDDQQQQQQRGKSKGKPAARGRDPEVENMRKRMQQLEDERRQEKETARNRDRDAQLREQLEAAGVDKNRIRGAVAVLRDSMKYDEKNGEWIYNAKRDGYEDPLDVAAGVAEWVATDEGKSYLAPPSGSQQQRSGSGTRPTGAGGVPKLGSGGGRPTQDPKAAKAQAKQEALSNLTKAIDSLGGGTVGIG